MATWVNGGDGGDLLVIQGAKHGRATAHAMANHAELARGDRDIASAQLDPSGNLQRGFHIRGQVAVVGEGAGLGIGGYHHDAPAGQVAQGGVVILNLVHPVMAKGHGGQALALRGGINLAGDSGIVKVANQNSVATALRQRC